jgi:hypothetical protein
VTMRTSEATTAKAKRAASPAGRFRSWVVSIGEASSGVDSRVGFRARETRFALSITEGVDNVNYDATLTLTTRRAQCRRY